MSEYGSGVEWYWQEETEELGEKHGPMPLCPPHISHGLTCAHARALAVIRLTSGILEDAWLIRILKRSLYSQLHSAVSVVCSELWHYGDWAVMGLVVVSRSSLLKCRHSTGTRTSICVATTSLYDNRESVSTHKEKRHIWCVFFMNISFPVFSKKQQLVVTSILIFSRFMSELINTVLGLLTNTVLIPKLLVISWRS